MGEPVLERKQAFALLQEFNKEEKHIKHALAVEAVMRYCARKSAQNETEWGIAGLIHDLDFEQFPTEHCTKTAQLLRERQWPEHIVRAVLSHGFGMFTDVEPQTALEKTLFAVDELTGLVAATALVRPSRSVMDMEPKSVKKKWKDKAFAAGVNRAVIEKGAALLGVDLTDLISDTIAGMREAAPSLGLLGNC